MEPTMTRRQKTIFVDNRLKSILKPVHDPNDNGIRFRRESKFIERRISEGEAIREELRDEGMIK